MGDCFIPDSFVLKQNLYILDKLIRAIYPDIYKHFKNEEIESEQFGTTWFITIFSQSLQYTQNSGPTEMLITVWDYFLVDGWKSIFKIILYIIGEFKKEFLLYKIHASVS